MAACNSPAVWRVAVQLRQADTVEHDASRLASSNVVALVVNASDDAMSGGLSHGLLVDIRHLLPNESCTLADRSLYGLCSGSATDLAPISIARR